MWAQLQAGWNQEGVGTPVAHCRGADVLTVSGVVTAQRGEGHGQAADREAWGAHGGWREADGEAGLGGPGVRSRKQQVWLSWVSTSVTRPDTEDLCSP